MAVSWSLANALQGPGTFLLTRRFSRSYSRSDIGKGLAGPLVFYRDASILGLRGFSQDLRNILDTLLWIVQIPWLIKELKRHETELVLTTVGNHWCPIAKAWLLKIASGLPGELYMMDDLESSAAMHSQGLQRTVGMWFARTVERHLLKRFATVWTISKGYGEHLTTKYGIRNTKLLPVPIRGREIVFKPLARGPITYLGYSGSTHGLYESSIQLLLNEMALRNRAGKGENFRLKLFIGSENPEIFDRFDNSDLIDQHAGLDNQSLLQEMGTCWFHFLPYSFLEEHRLMVSTSFSCKIAEYLLSGRPIGVFGPAYSSISRHFNDAEMPLVVNNADEIAKLFDELELSDEKLLGDRYHRLLHENHGIDATRKFLLDRPGK